MWNILRKVRLGNEEIEQFVYGCRTEEEAKEKVATFEEEGLFVKEYVVTREEYINHLIEKGYIIDGNKAIIKEGDSVHSTYLILHFAKESEERGYEESYCLKLLSYLDIDGKIIEQSKVDEYGNHVRLDGSLIEENLDKISWWIDCFMEGDWYYD